MPTFVELSYWTVNLNHVHSFARKADSDGEYELRMIGQTICLKGVDAELLRAALHAQRWVPPGKAD